jgi:hypothetical protein
MFTGPARRSQEYAFDDPRASVTTISALVRDGCTDSTARSHIRARRWQRAGRAIVCHNGPPTPAELRRIALLNCGPRAALTAFTSLEEQGLDGWEREAIHVLVPGGTHVIRVPGLSMRIHYVGAWNPDELLGARALHRAAPALVLAASTFSGPRPACGLLAAGVQQRLVTPDQLRDVVASRPRVRHRNAMRLAVADIAQGAQALSEIDFAQLCRRHRLPTPVRQAIRVERSGRRRYLDAEWRTASGRKLVAEVDGALHLASTRWWADQLRQNELVLRDDLVLRFPSVIFRHEQTTVVDQLRRGLQL